MTKNSIKNAIIVIAVLCAGIIVAYLAVLNAPKEEEAAKISAATRILNRNYEDDYPSTPREVVKAYADISQCYYDPGVTEQEIAGLAKKMRQLLDPELQANQSYEDYLDSLRAEILQYRQAEKIITGYSVSSGADVKYVTNENGELATLFLTFNIRENGKINHIKEQFILRKDKDKHWRILGWQLSE